MNEDLTQMTATDMAAALRAREVRSVEITEAVLARMERVDPIIAAFVTATPELALESAAESDRRFDAGAPLGPMDGIPYSIKDLEPTAGIRTTFGSKFFEDFVPDSDSAVAGLLRGSGGVLLGKTNTPDQGWKGSADNFVARTTVNPWNTTRTAGGSSGGAAAAVAAGMGPLAQGGDGAGSIRIPASFCGVVGLKPTYGRVPLYPAKDPWTSRVHNGPIARTVADAALMLGVMTAYDHRDPRSLPMPLEPYSAPRGTAPLSGTRALVTRDFGYGRVADEVAAVALDAAARLRELGCEVVEADPDWFDLAPAHRVMYAGGGVPDAFREHPEWIEPRFWDLLENGGNRLAPEIAWAERTRGEFFVAAAEVMETYDFVVSPTLPQVAWDATPDTDYTVIDGVRVAPDDAVSFMVFPFNLTGQPALSIPAGLTDAGMPVGLQIVGRRFADISVLHAGAALEAILEHPAWPEPTARPEGIDRVLA